VWKYLVLPGVESPDRHHETEPVGGGYLTAAKDASQRNSRLRIHKAIGMPTLVSELNPNQSFRDVDFETAIATAFMQMCRALEARPSGVLKTEVFEIGERT
jgi:hypothetical protein